MKPSDWKLGARLALGFGLPLLLLVTLATLAINHLNANNEAISNILNDRSANVQARFLRNAIIAGDAFAATRMSNSGSSPARVVKDVFLRKNHVAFWQLLSQT